MLCPPDHPRGSFPVCQSLPYSGTKLILQPWACMCPAKGKNCPTLAFGCPLASAAQHEFSCQMSLGQPGSLRCSCFLCPFTCSPLNSLQSIPSFMRMLKNKCNAHLWIRYVTRHGVAPTQSIPHAWGMRTILWWLEIHAHEVNRLCLCVSWSQNGHKAQKQLAECKQDSCNDDWCCDKSLC